jgi:transcription initiation factor TFIIB
VAVAKVEESKITNEYTILNEELGLPAKPSTLTMYIPRLASELDCLDRIRRRARTLAEVADDAGVTTSVHPIGFATVCLYMQLCSSE